MNHYNQFGKFFASSEGFPDVIVPVKRVPDKTARAIAGGLHEGSIGGVYPLYVMAIANGDGRHYEVHNLQDGTVAGYGYGGTQYKRKWVYNGGTWAYDTAHAFAEGLLADTEVTTWIKA